MKYVKMKIVSYDEVSNSLLCSFASDETASNNPDDYPAYAYQPLNMWPDVTDIEEIKRRIAVAGMWATESQAKEEQFKADPTRVEQCKAMVGQVVEYPVAQLLESPVEAESTPMIEVL